MIINIKTGWYGNVETFWSKVFETDGIEIFCCSDCGTLLQGKELKEFKRRKKENKDAV